MALTKLEKIENIKKQIDQLKNQEKLLQQQHNEQERRARTKRLCSRAGLIESVLPETITLTGEQFKTLLEKTTFSDFGRRILGELKRQAEKTNANKSTETATEINDTSRKEATQIEWDSDGDGSDDGG